MPEESMSHLTYLSDVSSADVAHLMEKEKTYGGSWKKRGGVGAFMMLARKWDRLENILSKEYPKQYDVFEHIKSAPGGADGSILAEIRDLRRYLLLVESEMVARGVVQLDCKHQQWSPPPGGFASGGLVNPSPMPEAGSVTLRPRTPEDGAQHASVWPWIVTNARRAKLSSGDFWVFYEPVHDETLWRLRLGIAKRRSISTFCPQLACYEDMSEGGMRLIVESMPEDARPYYPGAHSEEVEED